MGWMELNMRLDIARSILRISCEIAEDKRNGEANDEMAYDENLEREHGFPPRILVIAGSRVRQGRRADDEPAEQERLGKPERVVGADERRARNEAREKCVRFYLERDAVFLRRNFSMKVRIIIRPMENGRIAERKCAWGRKIPRRIAAGMIIARLFPHTAYKASKTNGLFSTFGACSEADILYVLSEIIEKRKPKSPIGQSPVRLRPLILIGDAPPESSVLAEERSDNGSRCSVHFNFFRLRQWDFPC